MKSKEGFRFMKPEALEEMLKTIIQKHKPSHLFVKNEHRYKVGPPSDKELKGMYQFSLGGMEKTIEKVKLWLCCV